MRRGDGCAWPNRLARWTAKLAAATIATRRRPFGSFWYGTTRSASPGQATFPASGDDTPGKAAQTTIVPDRANSRLPPPGVRRIASSTPGDVGGAGSRS